MEEWGEVHSADDKGSSEKIKRRFKTPQQLVGLEEFYNEHKYPTEEMRSQLAEELGLTEKQISGWFCHRRLKDKKLLRDEANGDGRQDWSSGVNQDHVSGLKQDSCGSTKQSDRLLFDPREVESRRLHRPNSSSADLTVELKGQYAGNFTAPGDTSSGSSSASRDRFCNQVAEHRDRFFSKNEVFNPNLSIGKSMMDVKYKPSGYLKRKGQVENAAITAVKRQLGRHYRDDGPLLNIHFDPLPPGAFESPIDDPDFGSHCAEDPTLAPPHRFGAHKQRNLDSRFVNYNSKADYRRSYEEGNFQGEHSFGYYDHQTHNQSKKKYGSSNTLDEFGGRKLSDAPEYHNGDMYVYNGGRENRTTTGHPAEETRQEFASNCLPPKNMKNSGRKDCYVHDYSTVNNRIVQNEKMKLEHEERQYSKSLHPGEEEPSRKNLKKDKRHRDRESSGYLNYDREKIHSLQDIQTTTRFRAKPLQQDGASFSLPPRKYKTTVSSLGVQSYMEEKDGGSEYSEE
ncbi:hypothetical protein MLD38_004174 [Melastoma candidum]|uniref:Uncharacterized protein n=1 Tax=Melastoma candidum TaxID=119954 RepID=A0ACB9S9I1_9MYRT|nr:hypothetical protein MLD38_004174 [Melastoma candidum]